MNEEHKHAPHQCLQCANYVTYYSAGLPVKRCAMGLPLKPGCIKFVQRPYQRSTT